MTIARIIAARNIEIVHCLPELAVADAIALLSARRIGAMPVLDAKGTVLGVFSERDVIRCLQLKGAAALGEPVAEAMTAPAVTVAPGTTVDEALALMTKRRFRHLPVTEGERMIDFVSIGDMVKYRIDAIVNEANAMRNYIRGA